MAAAPAFGEDAAAALLATFAVLAESTPNGWARVVPGAVASVSGLAMPTLNGVWLQDERVDPAVLTELLDEVAASKLPHCLQVRPGAVAQVADLAAARGMTPEPRAIPLMVLEDPAALPADAGDGALTIRRLAPEEADRHARLAAAGFGAPEAVFLEMMTPAALSLPGMRCYLGEVDGQAVTTGLGVTLGASVGIFNIATPPAHRRHGYGAAVTARAAADGLAAGARWAWLQSSDAGYPVYERLGFRTAEAWSCWISAPPSER